MNRYSFFLISALAFVFFFIINTTTFAQCTFLQPNGVNIAPTPPRPLEIVCGNLYEASETIYDVCLVLFEGDPNNLTAYKIDKETLQFTETIIPVQSFVFAFADSFFNTENGGLITTIITNGNFATGGDLTVFTTVDAVDFYKQVLGSNYASAGIIPTCSGDSPFCDDLIAFGFHTPTNEIHMWKTLDGGKIFTAPMVAVPAPVASTFKNGLVPTAVCNGSGGLSVAFGRPDGADMQNIMYRNTSTGNEQFLWTDTLNDGILKESSAAKNGEEWVIATYRAISDQYKITFGKDATIIETIPVDNPADPGPGDLSFGSVSAACIPNGNQEQLFNVAVNGRSYTAGWDPGGQIQLSQNFDDALINSNSGPIGTSKFANLVSGNNFMYYDAQNTLKYAQCLFITRSVPTLSEWGLMAMAGFLGLTGFMVIRRRKVAA